MDRGRGRTERCGHSLGAGSRTGRGRALLALALTICSLGVLALAASPPALAVWTATATSDPYGTVYEYVPYGPSPNEVADIYVSPVPNSPTVILVHGGGWRQQGPLGRLHLPAMALQQQGFTVFEINYDQDSLTTPAFSLEPDDVIEATRWAIGNGARYNANPAKVVLLGGSAGGQLVALAAERLDAVSPGTVDGVVTLSAPTNFLTLLPLLEANSITNESFETSVYRALGIKDETPTPADLAFAAEWSPALHAPVASCPRWFMFSSEKDFVPISQSQEMTGNLVAAGCRAKLGVVPGGEHSFDYFRYVKPAIFNFIAGL
jgi:acetyl esterase/lipase